MLRFSLIIYLFSISFSVISQEWTLPFSSRIEKSGKKIDLEVDGGINPETAKAAIEAGADVLVAGSYIFGSKNYQDAILSLRS